MNEHEKSEDLKVLFKQISTIRNHYEGSGIETSGKIPERYEINIASEKRVQGSALTLHHLDKTTR